MKINSESKTKIAPNNPVNTIKNNSDPSKYTLYALQNNLTLVNIVNKIQRN